jgi:hypothetical protein
LKTILQIVPSLSETDNGVGDYGAIIAKKLRETRGYETLFQTGDSLAKSELFRGGCEHAILHYVNYGYQKRGVPLRLLSILRRLRRSCRGNLVTIFHELYAPASPPWRSAFWLRPIQIHIARSTARLSGACIVSNEVALAQLRTLMPNVRASVHPVISNFGEPTLSPDQIAQRDPYRWVICGGTAAIEKSFRSFRETVQRIPEFLSPRELFVIGGRDNPAVRSLIVDLANVRVDYRPGIEAAGASEILSRCSFAWLDYFHHPDVPSSVILKSGAFAAYCAHGVIPVFPHRGTPISLGGHSLPGPFFIGPNHCDLPSSADRAKVASGFYDWYQRFASSEVLVRAIAAALTDSPAR